MVTTQHVSLDRNRDDLDRLTAISVIDVVAVVVDINNGQQHSHTHTGRLLIELWTWVAALAALVPATKTNVNYKLLLEF